MNNQEQARQIVSAGLERRKELRQEAQKEAVLEKYEQDMIMLCNRHCASAKEDRLTREEWAAKQEARRAAMAKAQALEDASMNAVRYYGLACMGMIWLSAVTQLPFWAAATMMLGGAVFPAAYIFRLYFPIEE